MNFTNKFNKKDLEIGKRMKIRRNLSEAWNFLFDAENDEPGVIYVSESVGNASFTNLYVTIKIEPETILTINSLSKGSGGGIIIGFIHENKEYFVYLNHIKGLVSL